MSLRKALAYSKKYARPYTRTSRSKGKSYIKTVTNNKVVKYQGGNQQDFQGKKYMFILRLVAQEQAQVRYIAIEAARQMLTKELDTNLAGNYYLEVKVHPHHILRNNKTAAGAGADRMSTGMSRSFGDVEGRAAIVRSGTDLFVIACETESASRIVREAFRMAKAKLPCSTHVMFETLKKPAGV